MRSIILKLVVVVEFMLFAPTAVTTGANFEVALEEATNYYLSAIYPPVDEEKCRPRVLYVLVQISYGTTFDEQDALNKGLRDEGCMDNHSSIEAAETYLNPLLVVVPEVPITAETPRGSIRLPRPRPEHGKGMRYIEGKYAYMRISRFSKQLQGDLEKDIQQLAKRPPRGLILDLNDNPGGLIDIVRIVYETFSPARGAVAITVKTRRGTFPGYIAAGRGPLAGIPVAVLMNGNTASASERLIGVLKRWYPNKVTLIGARTYGKGTSQRFKDSKDSWRVSLGVVITLTEEEAFPGPNTSMRIQDVGIEPDILVSPDTFHEVLVEMAVRALKQQEGVTLSHEAAVASGQ